MANSKNVTRVADICTGHGNCPPRPNSQGSPNVFVNFLAAHRKGDHWIIHCTHASVLSKGSGTVKVNNKDLGRVGDAIACGSTVAQGSPNVYAGD